MAEIECRSEMRCVIKRAIRILEQSNKRERHEQGNPSSKGKIFQKILLKIQKKQL